MDVVISNLCVRILGAYISPTATNHCEIVEDFCFEISNCFNTNAPTILCGDFNLPGIDWQTNSSKTHAENYFLNFCLGASLYQHVSEPTRGNNILDLIFSNNIHIINNLFISSPIGSSDHNCITFELNLDIPPSCPIKKLCFKQANYDALNLYLSHIDWKTMLGSHLDIDIIYNNFLNIVQFGIQKFIPTLSSRSKKPTLPPHISSQLRYKEAIAKSMIIYPNLKSKYDDVASSISYHQRRFQANREKRLMDNNFKNFYSIAKSALKPHSTIPSLHIGNSVVTNSVDIADELCTFFKSTCPAPSSTMSQASDNDPLFDTALMFLPDHSVLETLKELQPTTNSPDNIPNHVLKNCSSTLSRPIAHILRFSYLTGKIPSAWKCAKVIPLPKVPKPTRLEHYRPISITPHISKLAESFLHKDINSFCQNINAIPPTQHGFNQGHSVVTALLEFSDDILKSIDNRHNLDVVFLDISKAFDSIRHDILLSKISALGLGPNICSWLKNFLCDRTFNVYVNGTFSQCSSGSINSGVPQGSILAPILFNLFIRDIGESIQGLNLKIKQYADDIIIYNTFGKDQQTQFVELQTGLNCISNWCSNNSLAIAPHKCKVLHLGRSNPRTTYLINDTPVSIVTDSIKYLGVHFTPDLKWSKHLNTRSRSALGRWFTLFKFLQCSHPKILTRAYTTYVRPILEFSSSIWNTEARTMSDKAEKVQRLVTKMIIRRCFPKKYNIPPAYHIRCAILGLQSLKIRRLISDLTLLHSIRLRKTHISETNLPIPAQSSRTRGHKFKYFHQHVRLNSRKNSFFIRVPKIYNNLPESVVNAIDPKCFRILLIRHFKTQDPYDLSS